MSFVRSIGLATPRHSVSQTGAAALAVELAGTDADQRFIHAMHRRSGIDRRASVIADHTTRDDESISQSFYPPDGTTSPTTGERMVRYAAEAGALSCLAARNSLHEAKVEPRDITHLVTASCTGFDAPGVDAALMDGLQLSSDVQRTNIGFMGCHAAINALRVADALANAGGIVLVVCVELCTLHMLRDPRPDRIVANALFADGAGAMVVTRDKDDTPGWRVVSTASHLVESTRDAMAWRIGDHGFEMTLAEGVPGIVREHLGAWARNWLAPHGIDAPDYQSLGWAVHPGGPRILDATRDSLGLPEPTLSHSREILRMHGNMSSPTILFIMDRIRHHVAIQRAVLLAFGPGLTIEGALLKRV